jgi:hypothetical protein
MPLPVMLYFIFVLFGVLLRCVMSSCLVLPLPPSHFKCSAFLHLSEGPPTPSGTQVAFLVASSTSDCSAEGALCYCACR